MPTTSLEKPHGVDGIDQDVSNASAPRFLSRPWLLGWVLTALGGIYYFFGMKFGLFELPVFILGVFALWLPLGGLFYHLLRDEVADRLDRFTFAALASYSLTTLSYFGAEELHVGVLFYIMQAAFLAWFFQRAFTEKLWRLFPAWWQALRADRLNPTLALIIVGSLITCVKYNTYLQENPDGSALLATYHDNTGHAGYAYELMRHIPPLQNTMRAGQPEHAYHCFPDLTIGLIGRFTLQADLMRASLVYRYTVLEFLTCLSLFCLGRWLSGRAGGGYVAASLMFIFVYPFPEFVSSSLHYFFFTLEPHVSSFLEPIVISSCQAFSSVPMVYAIILGLLAINQRLGRKASTLWLPLLLGLMVAAEMRFRVQVFIPLLPGFLLMMAWFWIRSRKWSFIVAIAACVLVVALLRLEMKLPAYLKSSSEVLISFNGLARDVAWMNRWPFHNEIHGWLTRRLGGGQTFNWTWQVVCMSTFVMLNICGIPMMIAIGIYLFSPKTWNEHLPLTMITFCLFLGSLAGGILLNTTYDRYSLAGETLLGVCVYGFPIYCLIIWRIVNWAWTKWSPDPVIAGRVIVAMLVIGVAEQYGYPVTGLQTLPYTLGAANLSRADRGALAYLHDHTPPDSVVASATVFNLNTAIFSGIGGRACYLEDFNYPALDNLPGVIRTETRTTRLGHIWYSHTEAQMREALDITPINYLVEFPDRPLALHPQNCIRSVWQDADDNGGRVTVWQVLPTSPASASAPDNPVKANGRG
jgi:hypothetical protein